MLFETKRLIVRSASNDDIPDVIRLEEDPENRDYLWVGTEQEHRDEIEDPNHILCVFESKKEKALIGYALIRLDPHSHIFELRRIAIDRKGEGYGREVMLKMFEFAFEKLDINRFWLDVYPDNVIGIKLYESLGMHRDGVLRQNYLSDRGYLDQIIYSILKEEYFKNK